MPDNDFLPDDDEEYADTDAEADDSADTPPSEEQSVDKVAALEAQVAALSAQNRQASQDFSTAVGRYNSILAKLNSGQGNSDAAVRQLYSQLVEMNESLDAVLSDETLDPKVREKAFAARNSAASKAKLEALEAEIAAIRSGRYDSPPPAAPQAASADPILSFEDGLVSEIESYGLNPDDPAFDWKGQATQLLTTQGAAATQKYIRGVISSLLKESGASDRRQARKESGGGKVPAAGTATDGLALTNSDADNLKWLTEQGIIPR